MKPITITDRKNTFAPSIGEYKMLFPTPFFNGVMPLNHAEVRRDMDMMINRVQERYPDDKGKNYTTYFDQDLQLETHDLPWFAEFSNILKDTYIQMNMDMFGVDLSDYSRHDIHLFAWLNRYSDDHLHTTHDHVNSRISGTYYVSMGEGATPIRFHNPSSCAVFNHGTNNNYFPIDDTEKHMISGSPGTHTEYHFRANDGDMLMWPSYMLHSVDRAEAPMPEYKRYSISFNLYHNLKNLNYTDTGEDMSYSFLRRENDEQSI